MKKIFRNLGKRFLDLLFPKACLFCQREDSFLCQDCQAAFEIEEENFCLCPQPKLLEKAGKCKNCQAKSLAGLHFALSYEDPRAKLLIKAFKYEPYLRELAKPLASFILAHFSLQGKTNFPQYLLIPIPLEKRRLRKRGFNQAEEIAKYLAPSLGTPFISDCLLKIKKTPPQTKLSGKERERNLRGAFLVKQPERIRNKKIFLIDDVYTTGTTMEEAAKTLLETGAKEVWGIAIARAAKT